MVPPFAQLRGCGDVEGDCATACDLSKTTIGVDGAEDALKVIFEGCESDVLHKTTNKCLGMVASSARVHASSMVWMEITGVTLTSAEENTVGRDREFRRNACQDLATCGPGPWEPRMVQLGYWARGRGETGYSVETRCGPIETLI